MLDEPSAHVILKECWEAHSPDILYSIIAFSEEIHFQDGSVAIRAADDTWSVVACCQLRCGSEADAFVRRTTPAIV